MKYDLHIHSIYSSYRLFVYEGFCKPKDIVKMGIKVGLDGVAVTDHDTVKGSLKTREFAISRFPKFKVITGCEVRTAQGHVLALDIKEWNERKKFWTAEEAIEKIHDLGGIAIAAHPYHAPWLSVGDLIKKLDFDGVESFNAHCLNRTNEKAKDAAKRLKLPQTGGSDAHFLFHVGKSFTITDEDVIEAISKGRSAIGGSNINVLVGSGEYIYRFFYNVRKGGLKLEQTFNPVYFQQKASK